MELATLIEYGRYLKPVMVILLFFEANDLTDIVREQKIPVFRDYLKGGYSQNLIDRQDEIDALWTAFIQGEIAKALTLKEEVEPAMVDFQAMQEAAERYGVGLESLGPRFDEARLADAANRIVADFEILTQNGAEVRAMFAGMSDEVRALVNQAIAAGVDIPANLQPIVEQMEENEAGAEEERVEPNWRALLSQALQRIKEETSRMGSGFSVVYLPDWDSFQTDANYPRDEVLGRVREQDISAVDFYSELISQPDPLSYFPFRRRNHYSARGYRLLADLIETSILMPNGIQKGLR